MILHFSHIGLTDGRTFTLARFARRLLKTSSSRNPALATGSVAATGVQQRSRRIEKRARARNERC
jgi:hypothetical protein